MTDASRYERAKEIFLAACELPEDQRVLRIPEIDAEQRPIRVLQLRKRRVGIQRRDCPAHEIADQNRDKRDRKTRGNDIDLS